MESVHKLDRADRIAYFNAKKFLSFQLAKLLGKKGDTYLKDAREGVKQLSDEKGYAALPALPAILMPPPPSTAPAAATAPSATTAPGTAATEPATAPAP